MCLQNQAEVRTFRMHYMELDRYWRFEAKREKLLAAIAEFAASQRKLRIFVMNCAQVILFYSSKSITNNLKNVTDDTPFMNL